MSAHCSHFNDNFLLIVFPFRMAPWSKYVEMVLCFVLIFSEQPLTQYCSTLGLYKHVVCPNYQAWGDGRQDSPDPKGMPGHVWKKICFIAMKIFFLKIFKWVFFSFISWKAVINLKENIFPSASWPPTQRHRFVTSFGFWREIVKNPWCFEDGP